MKRVSRNLLLLFVLACFPSIIFGALAAPEFAAVKNYNGPIVVFWNTGANTIANSVYYIFLSTSPLTAVSTTTIANGTVTPTVVSTTFDGTGPKDMYATWNVGDDGSGPQNNQTYHLKLAVYDGTTAILTTVNPPDITSVQGKLIVDTISSVVDNGSSPNYLLDYDSSTITFTFNVKSDADTEGRFLKRAKVKLDIYTSIDQKSVFTELPTRSVTGITPSSSTFNATATYTWSGSVFSDNSHKHNGAYTVKATPIDSSDVENVAGVNYGTCNVNVVHTNVGAGLVYQTLGSNQPHYGPPFYFDYYMSKDSFVTWKIWDRNQTETTADDTLVKVIVSTAPRRCGDNTSAPKDWDKAKNVELWDGRDANGHIVKNNIYRFTFDAIEYWDELGSGFTNNNTDRAATLEGTIAYDVLRLVDLSATGITDVNALAHIKYTLAGADSLMGGATIKIVICSPGTTFYMASTSGSISYASGAGTYKYTAGDAIPLDINNLKKTFTFARTAGALDETWNGFDEGGNPLANDNYVFAISGTDDTGNHAIDNSGNDRIIIGNITIDRTSAQTATDSTPPAVSSVTIGGTGISITGNTTISSPFSVIAINLSDSGGSGVDLTGTTVSLTGPSTGTITITNSNNNTDTINLAFTQQSTNGMYTLRIRPRDKVGNTASDVICNFTLNITEAGVANAFVESTYAYPNPTKGSNTVNFAYSVSSISTMKLEIYNMLGESVYEERWTAPATGSQIKTWNIVNQSNNKLGTGIYLYRISSENISTKPKFKKLIIVQ